MFHPRRILVHGIAGGRSSGKRGGRVAKAFPALLARARATAIEFVAFVVRVVAHIKPSAAGASRWERLHDVGIRIVLELGPLDVGIAVVKVAKPTRAELEVQEDKGSQHQHAASDRDTDDETLAGAAAARSASGV